jgi:hypothetical protein
VALTPRQQKKRQWVRYGYTGLGVGAALVAVALIAGSIVVGVLGFVVLLVAGWATRALREL